MPEKPQEILARLQADDKLLFRELFHRHYQMVCQTTFRMLRDHQLSEDLAQDVFIRFWEKRKSLDIQTSLPAYLRRMAVNEALGYLRKQKRTDQQLSAVPSPLSLSISAEDQYLGRELGQRIHESILKLPPRCREVFILSRYEELSYREIGDRLDISIKTVENQMGKALRLLRGYLKPFTDQRS